MFYHKRFGFHAKGSPPTFPSITIDGDLIVTGTSTARGGHVGHPRIVPGTPNDSVPQLYTSGRAFARYVGQAQRDLTTIDVMTYLGTAAVAGGGGAALNWAEIALATGALETIAAGGNTDLTIRAYADMNAEALAAASNVIEKTLAGLAITAGTGLWVITAEAYQTTQLGMRAWDGVDLTGRQRHRDACQPSLNVGAALAFTVSTGVHPECWIRYP